MRQSDTIDELLKELVEVQNELPTMPKSSQAYGYKYTDLDTIVQAIKPILHKHGIGYMQSVGGIEKDYMTLTTRIFNNKGQYIEDVAGLPSITSTKNNAAQTLGMSITYMRRYALCAMLGITSDEDVDANTDGAGARQTGTAQKPPASKQTPPKGGNAAKPPATSNGTQKPAAKKSEYSFSEAEAKEMQVMFGSGLFPPEEQEMIRNSLRKHESTANEVLWATRRKYAVRAKAQAEEVAEEIPAEVESGASEAFDNVPPASDEQQPIF